MIKLFDYFSNWIGLFFILWIIAKYTKYSKYSEYINPYYGIYFIFYGFIFYILLNIKKGVKFDYSYIILGLITHYSPIYLFNLLKGNKNKYSSIVFISTVIAYVLYTRIILNKTPIDVYINDEQPKTIREFFIKVKLITV